VVYGWFAVTEAYGDGGDCAGNGHCMGIAAVTAFWAKVPSLVDIRVRRVTNIGQSHRALDANTSRKSDFSSVDELKIIMYFTSNNVSLISVY
jgi:hypothetical protein